jgi:ABC-type uncharacterized transport system auxiliary subunit
MSSIIEALTTSAGMLWRALRALIFGYAISAATQVLVGACIVGALVVSSCGGAPPATRYYTLASRGERGPASKPGAPLAVVALAVDSAYDTDRIVYRLSPYRLDYYNYHRWSAHPGRLVADYLRRAYARTGLFREVVAEPSWADALVLSGRIIAIEEIDESPERCQAHVFLQLSLRDLRGGTTVWSAGYERTQALSARNPEGLARALSEILARIVAESAPLIAAQARVWLERPGADEGER